MTLDRSISVRPVLGRAAVALAAIAAPGLAPVPAQAAPAAPTPAATAPAGPHPAVAGALALGAPLALAGGASVLNASGLLIGRPALDLLHYAAIFGAPLGFGLGHAYAGDPVRGALVGLGGLGAAYGAVAAGVGVLGLGIALEPSGAALGPAWAWTAGTAVALGGIAGYGLWAATDAAATAAAIRAAKETDPGMGEATR